MDMRRRNLLKALAAVPLLAPVKPVLADDLQVGKPAPPAELVTLDGKRIATGDLVGNPVILTFWATWCDPCREELPLLSRYVSAHRAQGLKVLGFCLDDTDTLDKVRAVATTLSFPVGLLAQSKAPGYGRIWRIPVSFVIDRHGLLRYNGWQAKHPEWTTASLQRVVAPLLQ